MSDTRGCVDQLKLLLTGSLSKRARVRVQSPVWLNELNEPQPDVTLLKMRDYSQDHDHPGPQDILLLIEVSDSTLDYDRTEKLPLFARSCIPEYWVVNLKDGVVEVYGNPVGDRYSTCLQVGPEDNLVIPGFPGLTISVSELLK